MRHNTVSRVSGVGGQFAFAAVLAATTGLTSQAHAQYAARVSPITNTATHAFNSSYYQRVPLNLATLAPNAYAEQEFTLSGLANVYQYANPSTSTDDSVKLEQTSPLAYVNRILVRMPTNPAKFSGNVIVEIANDALISDNQVAWPYANSYFTSNGDAYILLTSTPNGLATLKAYSPTRYRALTWPTAAATRGCSGGASGEAGIIYDELSELGNLLKSNGSGSPLAGYSVKHLFITGYSGAASLLLTYDRVFGMNSTLYDGYFVAAGGFRSPLNACEASSTATNRNQPPASKVSAVFQTQTTSELVGAQLETLAGMPTTIPTGTDSNTASNRYRLYEIAGGAHVNGDLLRFSPQRSDFPVGVTYLTDATQSQAQSECSQPSGSLLSSFPNRYVYDAMWANLEHWVASSTAYNPPSEAAPFNTGAYLLTSTSGSPSQTGGVRSPAVDDAIENYFSGTVVQSSNSAVSTFCLLTGYQTKNGSAVNNGNVVSDATTLAGQGFMTQADATILKNNPSLAFAYPDGTNTIPDNPPAQ